MASADMEAAIERLKAEVADLDLDDIEDRVLVWLTRWEPEVIDAFASIIHKARRDLWGAVAPQA